MSEFPDLAVAPPFVLTVDEEGWYRLTVVDPTTHNATSATFGARGLRTGPSTRSA
jgi:hypothetical protein